MNKKISIKEKIKLKKLNKKFKKEEKKHQKIDNKFIKKKIIEQKNQLKIDRKNEKKQKKREKRKRRVAVFIRLISFLLNTIIKIIISPYTLVKKIIYQIRKGFRFSITFKITAAYVGLYIIIMCVVIGLTAVGYFIYRIYVLDNESGTYFNAAIKMFEEEKDYNEIIMDKNINSINIYDEKFLSVLSTDNTERKYLNDIISKTERIFYNYEYTYSNTYLSKNGEIYYININYSMGEIYYETFVIIMFTFFAGIIGLLILISIGPNTSNKVVEPIKSMTEVARTVTVNNINTRLSIQGSQDELRDLSKTFNEMMDRIENGYKSQQRFVSDASHELRTPIAVIKGYVNMLDRWGKNDKAILEESINAIKNETDNMQDLIEKLLFIARSDKNTLKLSREDINILEILCEIEKETQMIDKNHEFLFDFKSDVIVYADKNRIKQAIRIFIENAIKFTPQNGKISICSYIEEDYYAIKITDTGIGINKNDMKKIFDRLYRAEESRSKDIGGHGLGLSIAKIIILAHKGKIKVKSKIDQGSSFAILLPYIKEV